MECLRSIRVVLRIALRPCGGGCNPAFQRQLHGPLDWNMHLARRLINPAITLKLLGLCDDIGIALCVTILLEQRATCWQPQLSVGR